MGRRETHKRFLSASATQLFVFRARTNMIVGAMVANARPAKLTMKPTKSNMEGDLAIEDPSELPRRSTPRGRASTVTRKPIVKRDMPAMTNAARARTCIRLMSPSDASEIVVPPTSPCETARCYYTFLVES